MDDQVEHGGVHEHDGDEHGGEEHGDARQQHGGHPALGRRRFLGAVGVAAGAAVAGCDSASRGEHERAARPSKATRRAVDTERSKPGSADWRIRSVAPGTPWRGIPTR